MCAGCLEADDGLRLRRQQNMPMCRTVTGATGLEPATSGVTGRSWYFRGGRNSWSETNPYARGRRVLSRLVARCIIVLGSQERDIRYESGFARAGGTEHAQTKRYPRRADLLQLRAIGQERHRPLGLARRAAVIGTSFRLQDKPSDFIG
jgi:hypothetical protein